MDSIVVLGIAGSGAAISLGMALFSLRMYFRIRNNQLSASVILQEDNQEVRSKLLEQWNGRGLIKLTSSPKGILYRTTKNEMVIKVINSTPEADGSFKIYWLRVPNNIRTVEEALAWTFGINEEEYKPVVET